MFLFDFVMKNKEECKIFKQNVDFLIQNDDDDDDRKPVNLTGNRVTGIG